MYYEDTQGVGQFLMLLFCYNSNQFLSHGNDIVISKDYAWWKFHEGLPFYFD